MRRSFDYVTVLAPVFEVTLIGQAKRAAWQTYLGAEGLTLHRDMGDKVEVSLSAIEARYKGITFREFSFSLRLDEDQIYLAHAYNSRRLFAFVERSHFRMPFYPAEISVESRHIAVDDGESRFGATLHTSTSAMKQVDESQEWMVRLPRKLRKRDAGGHFVQVHLEGSTTHYTAAGIELHYEAKPGSVWQILQDSEWQVQDWLVRTDATHRRSRTYQQRDLAST